MWSTSYRLSCYLAGYKSVSTRPSDPDTMANTAQKLPLGRAAKIIGRPMKNLRDARSTPNKEQRKTRYGSPYLSLSPPFYLQSSDLARRESFIRSVPAKYPWQCHVSFSTIWSLMTLFLHNLSIYIFFWGGHQPQSCSTTQNRVNKIEEK